MFPPPVSSSSFDCLQLRSPAEALEALFLSGNVLWNKSVFSIIMSAVAVCGAAEREEEVASELVGGRRCSLEPGRKTEEEDVE